DCRDVHGARVRMSRKLAGVQEIHDPRGSLCALDDRGRVHCYVVTWVEDRHELLDLHRLQSPAPMRSIFGAEQDSSLCGIDQDDRVWCWKELQGHDPPELQDLPPAREAARVGDRL